MKKNAGLTLIELLIAMTIAVGIIMFTGSVFLSANNLVGNMINYSKSHRTAQIAFMHIQKNIKDAACMNIYTPSPTITDLYFNDYNDVFAPTFFERKYTYDSASGEIKYYPDRNAAAVFEIVADHISNCVFTLDANYISIGAQITALDDDDDIDSACEFSGNIGLMCGPSQPVFTI